MCPRNSLQLGNLTINGNDDHELGKKEKMLAKGAQTIELVWNSPITEREEKDDAETCSAWTKTSTHTLGLKQSEQIFIEQTQTYSLGTSSQQTHNETQ